MPRLFALLLLAPLLLTAPARADGGTPVSIEATERNIRDVLTALAEAAGVQLVIRPEVRGVITTLITKTKFEQALTMVAAAQGYSWRLVDGVYHVGRFSQAEDTGAETVVEIPTAPFDPRALARAFGYLDLASLQETAEPLDLRALLPPGIEGVPEPTETGLKVTGTAAAIEDLRYLLAQLGADRYRIRYRVQLATLPRAKLDELPVYWAKGPMKLGETPGRDSRYSVGDFAELADELAAGKYEATPLAASTIVAGGLATGVIAPETTDGKLAVRLAGRFEGGLLLRVWLEALAAVADEPVTFRLAGASLPPSEGFALVALPRRDEPAVLLLVVPEPVVD